MSTLSSGWTRSSVIEPVLRFLSLRYRIARQLPGGRTLTFNSESTYDRENQQWTAPVNVMYSKVTRVGGQTMSFAGGVRGYLDSPRGGPDWGVRLVVTFLGPEK